MFKRSQVDEAIARVIEPGTTTLASELAGRVKRLRELDRSRGRNKRSRNLEDANFAFHTRESPGRGFDNHFSGYEAFALLIGLLLMDHRWPLGFVVSLLRQLRPELERHHKRILAQDPSALFNELQIRAEARPGQIAVDNTDPVFLVVVSQQGSKQSMSSDVCRGQGELSELYRKFGPGYTFTLTELVNSAHDLSAALAETRLQHRGRARG